MKMITVVTVLVLFSPVNGTGQAAPMKRGETMPAFPLFVSCDLREELVAPGMDSREVLWMSTPVSREGARLLELAQRDCVVTPVPLVLETSSLHGNVAPAAPVDPGRRGIVHQVGTARTDCARRAAIAKPAIDASSPAGRR